MTLTDRLGLLLPLANRDKLKDSDLRGRLFRFLEGFQAPGFRLGSEGGELYDVRDAATGELKTIAKKVQRVFDWGLIFEGPRAEGTENFTTDDMLPLRFPSLKFGAFKPTGRKRASFTLTVAADELRDLVAFLVMHILTTEEVRVGRCHAPAPRDYKHECGRVFMWSGQGRPRLVCSTACATRVKAKRVKKRDAALVRREREEFQAANPKRKLSRRKRRS